MRCVLLVVFAEGADTDEDHELTCIAVLFAQLFGGAAGEFGEGLEQVVQHPDGTTKRSCARN